MPGAKQCISNAVPISSMAGLVYRRRQREKNNADVAGLSPELVWFWCLGRLWSFVLFE
jgi:hypothetical protein